MGTAQEQAELGQEASQRLKSTTKKGLDIDDNYEKKTLELKAEFESFPKLMKEVLASTSWTDCPVF